MNVAIVSHFRNAVHYLERYFEQMDGLKKLLNQRGDDLSLVLGYGDSVDGTGEALYDECIFRFCSLLVDVSHGGQNFGSIVHPQRFEQLAFVANKLWDSLPKQNVDMVGAVESDLIWQPSELLKMIENVRHHDNLIIAPMVYHRDYRFYDKWAFRLNGKQFSNEPPYHPDLVYPLEVSSCRFYKMDSVGSVLFMKSSLAYRLCFPKEDVVVGFCNRARELGVTILLDTWSEVFHP